MRSTATRAVVAACTRRRSAQALVVLGAAAVSALLPMSALAAPEHPTTIPGYVNRNAQTVLRATGRPATDHQQRVYELSCGTCGPRYGSNGSDNFQRKCPSCQGGAPGLPLE